MIDCKFLYHTIRVVEAREAFESLFNMFCFVTDDLASSSELSDSVLEKLDAAGSAFSDFLDALNEFLGECYDSDISKL